MAKRQNFVVGSTSSNVEVQTDAQLNHAWDSTVVLHSNTLNGVFNAVSDYSNDSSNEIANAIASITGSQPTGDNQSELAAALQLLRQEIETSSLTFKGYIATSAPSSSTYALETGNIWINSATLPTSFPVAIAGVWDGTQWVSTTDTYSPSDFDFFRNLNDNEGYYWFGGQWTVMSTDLSTTYFTLNQNTGKWEIKSSVELPGTPTVETAPGTGDNTKKIPTTEWVNTAIGASSVPAGGIMPYGGSTAPTGWLLCNGQAVSRTTYAALFAAIGTTYGTGDGSTTFNLPNASYIVTDVNTTVGVKGNGKSLGLTDGSSNAGLVGDNGVAGVVAPKGDYNKNVGSNTAGGGYLATNKVVGVVQDTSTSGLTGALTRTRMTCKFVIKY